MINVHTDGLDQMDEQELYLTLQIARHMGKNGQAWPGLNRLIKLTRWSKNTVLKVTKRCEKKGFISTLRQRDSQGMNAPNKYRIDSPHIGIYIPAKDVADDANEGSSRNELGVVHEMNQGGSRNEPEVLSNEVLGIGRLGMGELQKLIDAEPITPTEIDDLLPKSGSVKKEKSSGKKEKDGPVTIETAARRDAMIRSLAGQAAPVDEVKTAPAPLTIEEATEAIMAEIETEEGQAQIKSAAKRKGIEKLPSNIYGAVYRYVEHRTNVLGKPLHPDPIRHIGGYLQTVAEDEIEEANTVKIKKQFKNKTDATQFQPKDNPSTYDYDNLPDFNDRKSFFG